MSTATLRNLRVAGRPVRIRVATTGNISGPTPNVLRATPNGLTGAFVAWADTPNAASYSLQRSPDNATWTTIASSAPTGWTPAGTVATAPPYVDSGLTANTVYYYRVAANGSWGTGPYSSSVSITTHASSTLNGRRLLQPSDLTYLGSFALPASVSFTDGSCPSNGYNYGALAVRYVGGTARLMTTAEFNANPGSNTAGFGLYEVAIPADGSLKTASPWTTASVVKAWGNVWQGRGWHFYVSPYGWSSNIEGGGTGWAFRGIYWDATDSRLYFGYGSEYGSSAATDDPTIGFVTLDDGGGTYAAYGPWRVGTPKRDEGGVVGVPSWFATAYLSGQRLAAGFGGSYSLITAGGGGYGPGLDSFAPPSAVAYNPTQTLAITGGTPTSGNVIIDVLGPTGGTSWAAVTIPYNATAADVVSAFNAVLGSGSATASGGPLPGTAIDFQLQTNCTFWDVDSGATTINAGTAVLTGSATDSFAPTLTSTNLIGYTNTGNTGPRDTDYENRHPTLMSYGTVGTVTASGGVNGLPTVVLPTSDNGSACAHRLLAGGTLQLLSGSGSPATYLVLDSDVTTQTITLGSAFGGSGTPVSGQTVYALWDGGYHPVVTTPASSGATTLLCNGGVANPAISKFGSGAFVGSNLYVVSGTGAFQGPIPITGYTYNSGTGIGTLTLGGGGLTAAVDTTSQLTIDGPQFWGAIRAASGNTVQLWTGSDPSTSYTSLSIDYFVKMISGSAAGEEHKIASYAGSTRTATLDASWIITPSAGDLAMIRAVGFGGVTDEYNPTTSRGYQSFFETYDGSACWVDTGTSHGLLMGSLWSVGQTTYNCSQSTAEGFKHAIQCFDPATLAGVAQGSIQPNAVDSSWEWYLKIPAYTYPILATGFGYKGDPPLTAQPIQKPPGMAFDATTNRLYVMFPWGSSPIQSGNAPPLVMVFGVAT